MVEGTWFDLIRARRSLPWTPNAASHRACIQYLTIHQMACLHLHVALLTWVCDTIHLDSLNIPTPPVFGVLHSLAIHRCIQSKYHWGPRNNTQIQTVKTNVNKTTLLDNQLQQLTSWKPPFNKVDTSPPLPGTWEITYAHNLWTWTAQTANSLKRQLVIPMKPSVFAVPINIPVSPINRCIRNLPYERSKQPPSTFTTMFGLSICHIICFSLRRDIKNNRLPQLVCSLLLVRTP